MTDTARRYALYTTCVLLTAAVAYLITNWWVVTAVLLIAAAGVAIPLTWPARFGDQT